MATDGSSAEPPEERPRVVGSWVEPDDCARPLLQVIGKVVVAVGGLEKAMQLELARLICEEFQRRGEAGSAALGPKLEVLTKLPGGELLRRLRTFRLPADLAERIDDAIQRRNQLVHHLYEDPELAKAVIDGADLSGVLERLERLAVDSGELAVELQLFAMPRLEALFGATRAQMVEMVKELDPATLDNARDREQLEALQALTNLSGLATALDELGDDHERSRCVHLQNQFADTFADTGLELPAAAAAYGCPGWLRKSGWSVSFIWGDSSQYIEYEASWGLAGDQFHRRLWADGRTEELDALNEFAVAAIEPEVATAVVETGSYNRGVERVLVARGLFPWPELALRHEVWSERELWSSLALTPNALLKLASEQAAALIDATFPKPSFLESKIETALLRAIGERVDPGMLGARKREFDIPGWIGDLRGIDFYIRDSAGQLCVGCELKVDDVQWTLWDVFKLVNTFSLPSVDAAFLVVAATEHTWASDRPYVAFFDLPPGAALRWPTRNTIERWPSAWNELLAGGPARPVTIPAEIEIEAIARAPVAAYPGYELRTIAVRPVPDTGSVVLGNGWPIDQ